MQTIQIPQEEWNTRLNKLSQAFEGWLVSLDVIARSDGELREFRQVPLVGITAEPGGPIVIAVAEPTGDHVTHIIRSPTRVLLEKTSSGANAALEVCSADGTRAILRFRTTAMRVGPEDTEGIDA